MTNTQKSWFITGASAGFGRLMAEQLLADGQNVVATARKPESLSDLASQYHDTLITPALDVTKQETISASVDQTIQKFGQIDVLVNNAGYGQIGAIEELSDQEIETQFNTNVFGLIKVTQAALPHMRQRRQGHILNLSSIAGLMGFPGFGIYCASKFAVEAVSEAMSAELAEHNIKVTLIEPGAFRTRFANSASIKGPANQLPAYNHITPDRVEWLKDFDGTQPGDPEKAVEAMINITQLQEPPMRLLLGNDAWENAHKKIDRLHKDFDAHKETTLSCNFPDAEVPNPPNTAN